PWRLRRMEGRSDFFKALLWLKYEWDESFRITFTANGKTVQKAVRGVTGKEMLSQRESAAGLPLWDYETLEQTTGLLTIRSFRGDEKEFSQFLESTFKQINKAGVTDLIIDVRDNLGGDSGQVG